MAFGPPARTVRGRDEDWADFSAAYPAKRLSSAERTEKLQFAGITFGRRFQRFKHLEAFSRWLIASVCANRSRDRSPAFKQYPIAFSIIPASVKCSASSSGWPRPSARTVPRCFGDPLMKSPALGLADRTVQRFLDQHVLEE